MRAAFFTYRHKSFVTPFAEKVISVFLLCAFCVLCGEISAQDFKHVHPGVEYAQVVHKIGSDPVKINLLRLDLTKVRIDVHHAHDKAIGLETTSSIAKRKKAVAAINAGFFRLDTSEFAGDASGTLVIDKSLLSESQNGRVALGIINRSRHTEVYFGHPEFVPSVKGEKYTGVQVDGINRERKKDETVVYTPIFGLTTRSNSNGTEATVEKGKIVAINRGGNNEIPKDGFILSVEGEDAESRIDHWKIGSRVKLSTAHSMILYDFGPDIDDEKKRVERLLMFESNVLYDLEDVTNGVPQLIENGKIDITWEEEKANKAFVETRHPRTAVAKMKDGKFLMITVDGRQPGVSIGMNLYELADYLLSLGAVDAINLDGGGSTTMFLDGGVVNTPSDKEGERKIGDAILVTLRKTKTKK